VYALEKIVSFARENQYLFVANCVWWIAGIIGLDSELTIFIDNLEIRRNTNQPREISTTPRDVTRSESVDPEQIKLEESILRNPNKNPSAARRVTRSNPAGGVPILSKRQRRRIAKAKRNLRKIKK
jgi:hypothetical protein